MVRCARFLILAAMLAGCTERVLIYDVWDASVAPNAPDAPDAPSTPLLDAAEAELPGRLSPDACYVIQKHAHFRPEAADLMILLDRSSNMQGNFPGSYSKLMVIQSALVDAINTYQKAIKFGFAEFPDPSCGWSSCCPAREPTVEPGYNAPQIFDALQCNEPQGCLAASADSPSHDALAEVQDYEFIWRDSQSPKYVLLIAASEPSCGAEGTPEDACSSANQAANTLGNMEIPVVVLTVGYQPNDKSCLVKVSKGGNKISMPAGAGRLYTPQSTSDLKANLSTLFGAIARSNCTLSARPPDYVPDDASIAIKIGNNTIPQADCNASSGWCYPTAASRNQIMLLGSTCDQYLQMPQLGDPFASYSCSTCSDSGFFCYW